MGMFTLPNPADIVASVKDDALKRQAVQVGLSVGYSQYITGLYELGKAIQGKRFIGFLGPIFIKMAASCFCLLQFQTTEKLVYFGVSKELMEDKALLDSIYVEEIQQK
jgi:hypothetical protein